MADQIVERADFIKRQLPKPIARAFASNSSLDRTEAARGYFRVFEAAFQYLVLVSLAKMLRAGSADST